MAWSMLWLLVLAGSDTCVFCRPSFQDLIPNGANVMRNGEAWSRVGHMDLLSGGLNPFGEAFRNAETLWTEALCREDSDGDGQSNGLELGDPDCVWLEGDEPARTSDISHPGFADSTMGGDAGSDSSPSGGDGGMAGGSTSSGDDEDSTTEGNADDGTDGDEGTAQMLECSSSDLVVDGAEYTCASNISSSIGQQTNPVLIHWRLAEDGKVDLALTQAVPETDILATEGWLALGFPDKPGQMRGAHAVVAETTEAGTEVSFWTLNGKTSLLIKPWPLNSFDVPAENADARRENGKTVLTISGVKFEDPSNAQLIYAANNGRDWKAYHDQRSGFMLNVVDGVDGGSGFFGRNKACPGAGGLPSRIGAVLVLLVSAAVVASSRA